MIHTSTSEVYGIGPHRADHRGPPLEPQSPTRRARSRRQADRQLPRSFDLPGTVAAAVQHLRAASVRTGDPADDRRQALAGTTLRLGSLHPRRDLTYVEDTAAGSIAVAEAGDEVVGRTLQLGTGTDVSVGDLVQVVGELLGKELTVELDPARVRPAKSEVERLISSPALAAELTGWAPTVTVRDGVCAHDRVDRAPRRALPRRRVRDLSDAELERIRAAYQERDAAGAGRSAWLERPVSGADAGARRRAARGAGRRRRRSAGARVLEVGCGSGYFLSRLSRLRGGARGGDRPHGAPDRAGARAGPATRAGRRRRGEAAVGGRELRCRDPVHVRDLVLDDELRRAIAAEMWRVLRAGGTLVSYDMTETRRGPRFPPRSALRRRGAPPAGRRRRRSTRPSCTGCSPAPTSGCGGSPRAPTWPGSPTAIACWPRWPRACRSCARACLGVARKPG